MKYKVGDIIHHKIFGKGKVTEVIEREAYVYGFKANNDPDIVVVEFDKPMLTEMESKYYWWIRKPIKVREFNENELPKYALIDEF